jgi:hypothetical protein
MTGYSRGEDRDRKEGIEKGGLESMILNRELQVFRKNRELPKGTGKYTRELDRALPGTHTKRLYDTFKRSQAGILAQLRTGMARLNEHLHRIGAAESGQCYWGQALETVSTYSDALAGPVSPSTIPGNGYQERVPILLPRGKSTI